MKVRVTQPFALRREDGSKAVTANEGDVLVYVLPTTSMQSPAPIPVFLNEDMEQPLVARFEDIAQNTEKLE